MAPRSSLALKGSQKVNYRSLEQSGAPKTTTEETEEQENDIFSLSVTTSTKHIFGLYGLEVWKFEKANGTLINIPITHTADEEIGRSGTGLFVKRITQEADYNSPDFRSEARDAYERLTDSSRLDFLAPESTRPGVGLPGILWSETSTASSTLESVQHGVQAIRAGVRRMSGGYQSVKYADFPSGGTFQWRDVNALAQDPDQPFDERLQAFSKAGFTQVSGVPFDNDDFCGIILLFFNPHASAEKIMHPSNLKLMKHAAGFIGAAASVKETILNARSMRNSRPSDNWSRLRVKILAVVRFQYPVRKRYSKDKNKRPRLQREPSFSRSIRKVASFARGINREKSLKIIRETTTAMGNDFKMWISDRKYSLKGKSMRWWNKIKGGNAKTPPAFSLSQCMWTFTGVMTTHTILSLLNGFVVAKSSGELSLVAAPFGALTTLQYNLTAAPASQPRNAFFSQIFALSTAYFLHQIPNLDPWMRTSIAPAIVVTGMARFGIIHPPAGAAVIAFTTDNCTLEQMGLFLLGVCIAITTALAINNLSDKRQYPLSWPILNAINESWH